MHYTPKSAPQGEGERLKLPVLLVKDLPQGLAPVSRFRLGFGNSSLEIYV